MPRTLLIRLNHTGTWCHSEQSSFRHVFIPKWKFPISEEKREGREREGKRKREEEKRRGREEGEEGKERSQGKMVGLL